MIQRCYPFGKTKAFNVTYDDGVLQDVRFVKLLNYYGLKGTFNLNSQLMEEEFEWEHESGMTVKRLPLLAVRGLYCGHEIASHTLTHPYLHDRSESELMWEIGEDKRRLEALLGGEVAGFAVPFDFYSEQIAGCVKACGFEYGRISEESHGYSPWQDPWHWRAGVFHLSPELDAYVDGFLKTNQELAVCQIVGHSYDLDAENMWERMDRLFERVATARDVYAMTHIEIVRYIQAMKQAVITDEYIQNNSDQALWFNRDGQVFYILPGADRCL